MAATGPLELTRDDVVELTGQVCALARAGVGSRELWPVLAGGRGPSAEVGAVVAGMVGVGGSAAEGLRLAELRSGGPGAVSLGWLAITLDVSDRSGAPAAAVIDQVGEALLAELSRAGERDVALAGSRATATLLGCMPALGAGLGLLMGVNTPTVLLGSTPGRICLVLATGLWLGGRAWAQRLIATAERAGQ